MPVDYGLSPPCSSTLHQTRAREVLFAEKARVTADVESYSPSECRLSNIVDSESNVGDRCATSLERWSAGVAMESGKLSEIESVWSGGGQRQCVCAWEGESDNCEIGRGGGKAGTIIRSSGGVE